MHQNEIDTLKAELYDHYHHKHKQLYEKEPTLYWHHANLYVEKAIQEKRYYHTSLHTLRKKTDHLEDPKTLFLGILF